METSNIVLNYKKKLGGQNKTEFNSFSEGILWKKCDFYIIRMKYQSKNKLLNVLTEDGMVYCRKEAFFKKKPSEIGFMQIQQKMVDWETKNCNLERLHLLINISVFDSHGDQFWLFPIEIASCSVSLKKVKTYWCSWRRRNEESFVN